MNKPIYIWQASDSGCEEIDYLINNGKLTIKEDDDQHYFNAFLWGADLSAARDATVIFYSIDRDEVGKITDISFNFIANCFILFVIIKTSIEMGDGDFTIYIEKIFKIVMTVLIKDIACIESQG